MPDIAELMRHGTMNPWLLIPTAILLGALHGLEPGHSKTMMAAFIVAIRGTVTQAVLLGMAATVSHTAVVWAIALGGMYFGSHWDAETSEPYFQIASAVLILGVAAWMTHRTWAYQRHVHHHRHDAPDHRHHDHEHNHNHPHEPIDSALEAMAPGVENDPHERAHAQDIQRRFAGREVTTGQIVMFGLTGGLIPCPAAITVLLLCLQLKRITVGAALVLCFSIGLALTLVASGVLAALSVKYASKRWSGFGRIASKAPYFSGALITLVGLYIGYVGLRGLM